MAQDEILPPEVAPVLKVVQISTIMDATKNQNNPEKSSRSFSEEWTKAWQQLEERVRQRPGPDLLMTFAIGYFLQMLPIENLL
jgi:hypothetical protein